MELSDWLERAVPQPNGAVPGPSGKPIRVDVDAVDGSLVSVLDDGGEGVAFPLVDVPRQRASVGHVRLGGAVGCTEDRL